MGLILIVFCQVVLLGLTAYVAGVSLELAVMTQVVCLCSIAICSYLIEIKQKIKGEK
jgi:heme A synthase